MSRTYYGETPVLRLDSRLEETAVEEITRSVPRNIMVTKKKPTQAQYRYDCMNGQEHPMQLEHHAYTLVTVHRDNIDIGMAESDAYNERMFNSEELDYISTVVRRPEVEWAMDNSFDGVYIQRHRDPAQFTTVFRFAVYMKEDQATFWKLKFNGQ